MNKSDFNELKSSKWVSLLDIIKSDNEVDFGVDAAHVFGLAVTTIEDHGGHDNAMVRLATTLKGASYIAVKTQFDDYFYIEAKNGGDTFTVYEGTETSVLGEVTHYA
jgi:hypothetical protein